MFHHIPKRCGGVAPDAADLASVEVMMAAEPTAAAPAAAEPTDAAAADAEPAAASEPAEGTAPDVATPQ